MGNNFTEIFAPYLPGSNLKRLDLENCNFVGSAAARDLREVLTSAQIPDDWLGNLDTSTLRSIATGNPGTNLSWINLANNQLDDIGVTVLCQILPGTEISINNLLLIGNNISRALLQQCGDLGHLSSPASSLRPGGPYSWLFRQLQLSRNWVNSVANDIFEMNSRMPTKLIPVANQNAVPFSHSYNLSTTIELLRSTVYQFMTSSLQATGFTLLTPVLNYTLKRIGVRQDKTVYYSEILQTFISLTLAVCRSPIQGLALLLASAIFNRILPNTETRQFCQVLLTIGIFGLQSALYSSGRMDYVALQLWVSLLGALVGQGLTKYALHSVNNSQSSLFTFWQDAKNIKVHNDKLPKDERKDLRPVYT